MSSQLAPTSKLSFDHLNLLPALKRAVRDQGYEHPTPIQEKAIPPALEGRDVFGSAQTGTVKTAAFVLPILERMTEAGKPRGPHRIRGLVLTPTRELAAQITESASTYGAHLPITHTVVYGGVGQRPQEVAIRKGVDLLVACPGRLLDLMNQKIVDLSGVEFFVLDEADRMLDMGFIHDVRRIIAKLPTKRQTMFFSATVPAEIRQLAGSLLINPVKVQVAPVSATADTVAQAVYHVGRARKTDLLRHLLDDDDSMARTLVFTRTKHGADRVAKRLVRKQIDAQAIHGGKSQGARTRALDAFKKGKTRVLVASDIAARGIDIEGITHVVNFELPHEPETYVHRIGRTGRAGNAGQAISFCDSEEKSRLGKIQQLINRSISVIKNHPYAGSDIDEPPRPERQPRPARSPRSSRNAAPQRNNRSARAGQRRNRGGKQG